MSGLTVEQELGKSLIETTKTDRDRNDEQYAELVAKLKAEGTYGTLFPELLISRCREWQVNPAIFHMQASFDSVIVYQVYDLDIAPSEDGSRWVYKGTNIEVADRALTRSKNLSPRGILISAGLAALEQLNTHGIEIGDYVRLLRMQPYRVPVGDDRGAAAGSVILCDAASIRISEDCMDRLRGGQIRRKWTEVDLPSGHKWQGYRYEGTLSSGKEIPGIVPIYPSTREEML